MTTPTRPAAETLTACPYCGAPRKPARGCAGFVDTCDCDEVNPAYLGCAVDGPSWGCEREDFHSDG